MLLGILEFVKQALQPDTTILLILVDHELPSFNNVGRVPNAHQLKVASQWHCFTYWGHP